MPELGKPVWSQGTFMRPQHFQQQERYWASFVNELVSGRSGAGWGLGRLEIDHAALDLGRFEVNRIALIMADGTPLSAPGFADLPPPRALGPEAQGKRVLLALPACRSDTAEVSSAEATGPERRWRRSSVSLRDTTSEDDEYCEVQLCRLAPVLLLEGEPADTYETVPIARVASASETEITLDENYLPPVTNCRCHPGYMRTLRDILATLRRRAAHLASQIDPNTAMGMSDTLDFLLLQTVNRHEAAFAHIGQLEHIAPERAYAATVELAGELSTFLPGRRAESPPAYDHADPGPGWRRLVQSVLSALGRVSDRHGVELPLQHQPNGAWAATIHDRGLLDAGRFIVVVRARAPREFTGSQIERRLKVCSTDRMREIVALQLSGIPCTVVSVVPPGLPYYPNATYFEVDRTVDLWEEVRSSGTVAIYLMTGPETTFDVALWALRDSEEASSPTRRDSQ